MVNGIYFLSKEDFTTHETIDGELLALTSDIKGMNLVLFYSNECKYCDDVITEFKKLPHHIFGCNFSMINLKPNPEVTHLSKNTITKLTYVPELILFYNNLPFSKYEGEANVEDVKAFLKEVSSTMDNHSFTKKIEPIDDDVVVKQTQPPTNIVVDQPFSKKNKNVCYLKDGEYICS